MSDPRGARPGPAAARPRFRCLGCRAFVTGTDSGHCPRCGWVPPHVTPVPPAARSARRQPLASYLIQGVLLVLLVAWVIAILYVVFSPDGCAGARPRTLLP